MTHPMIPAGWELHPQQAQTAMLSPESGDYLDYGGADFSSTHDANGHLFFAAFAKPPNGSYAFYIFRDSVPLPLAPRPVGRGQIQPEFRVTAGVLTIFYSYVAGTNGVPQSGVVPQFAAFTVPLGGSMHPPLAIPATDPIWQLYTGEYTPSDLDTPAELALRINKQIDALRNIVAVLVARGDIIKG